MTEQTEAVSADDNRRQVLYWRLLARLFDNEEQASLESASLAVVEDIGLPAALLDPHVGVDSVVQRHPELAAELDGLMVQEPDGDRDRAAEVRRAALVSKVLLNVFATGAGNVTADQLARWQADATWLERALGCEPGGLRGRPWRQRWWRRWWGQRDRHRRRRAARPQQARPGDRPRAGCDRGRPRQADAAA